MPNCPWTAAALESSACSHQIHLLTMMLCSMEYTFGQFGLIATLCLFPACSPPWPAVWGNQSEKRRNLKSMQIQFSSSQSTGMVPVKNPNHSIIKDPIKKINFTSARSSTPPTLQWWRNHLHGHIWASEPIQAAEPAKTQNLHLHIVLLASVRCQLHCRSARDLKQNGRWNNC